MSERGFVNRVWYGDDALSIALRVALLPAEMLYRAAVRTREALYDAGVLRSVLPVLPTISVGNLSVGGTGKTPIAAWLAGELLTRGARPAIVLRGYGDDEPRVHQLLNPRVIVVANADRVAGVASARNAGATIAVLDDAFQHRRVRRDADLVLVSADRWRADAHQLPAGPLREGLHAIGRASMVIVTRKAATTSEVDAVNTALAAEAPRVPRITVRLEPHELVAVAGTERRPASVVAGRDVSVLAAIGDPRALARQLEALGARVTLTAYPDHHPFAPEDVATFAASVSPDGLAVCTLKDAVKLQLLWPREAGPLWYVSQRVAVERGVGGIERILDDFTRALDRSHH